MHRQTLTPVPRSRRRRRVAGFILATLALLVGGCATQAGFAESATTSQSRPFSIMWAGDTLLADAAQPLLDARGYDAPFAFLAPLLRADYFIVNLEGPITVRTTSWDPDQRWSYHARPAAAAALADLGVDAVGLANNHALDRGPAGLADTTTLLRQQSVATFGAGANRREAALPLLIDTPFGRVAVVGFGEDDTAGRRRAGSLVPSYTAVFRGRDLGQMAGAQWFVAFVHWGTNYRGVEAEQRRWAQRFADAGYDLVIGHGPHIAQAIDFVDGMPVFYSLGNFAFGTPGRYSADSPGISLLVTTDLTARGFVRAEIVCLLTDNDVVGFQPRRCPDDAAQTALSALHPDVQIDDGVGILSW